MEKTTLIPLNSDKIDKITIALCKARSEFPVIGANRTSHNNKYSDLHSIFEAVIPILNKNGLMLIQGRYVLSQDTCYLVTRLIHISGQFFISVCPMEPSQPRGRSQDQEMGSHISYNKRYEAMSMLGITIEKDPLDNDGNAERRIAPRDQINKIVVQKVQPSAYPKRQTISEEQLNTLNSKLVGKEKIEEWILQTFNIKHLVQLPVEKFNIIIDKLDG